jgi:hypothetical protein
MKYLSFLLLLTFGFSFLAKSQDTLAGNYENLTIAKGKHIINTMVIVSNKLQVDSGAIVEFIENGTLICGGAVNMTGSKNDIRFYGKKNAEGVGIIFNNSNEKSIIIDNVTFTNLQMPLYFDFGWKRNFVSITNNIFSKNIGKVSLIQVLNTPFGINDSSYVEFILSNNLIAENNAPVYFEDLKSDQIHYDITNNVFTNNMIYGSKTYNITSNVLYGRLDQSYTKHIPTIEGNSFVNNTLVDISTDTILHLANIGVYGTEKSMIFKNNYWGDNNKYKIYDGVYDQERNYSFPKLILEPFLNTPLNNIYTHIYNITNTNIPTQLLDTVSNISKIRTYTFRSNKQVDYTNGILEYINLKNDTTLQETIKKIKFNATVIDKNNVKIDLLDPIVNIKQSGYFRLSNLFDIDFKTVPEVTIGHKNYMIRFYKQKVYLDSISKLKGLEDEADKISPLPKFKKYWEIGLSTGGSIFTGSVSSPSLFSNEVTLYNSLFTSYHFSNSLSFSLNFAKFTLGNNDFASSNLDQIARGFHFTTDMMSITPMLNFKVSESKLNGNKFIYTGFFGLGADFIKFNPTSSYKGVVYNLQELGTGGQFIDSSKSPYSLSTFGVTVSYRYNINLGKKNTFGIAISYHRVFSNYIDDVGGDTYPNADKLYSKSGAAAVYFANPTSDYIIPGRLRSSPDNPSDSYILFNLLYTRKLFK